MVNDVNTLNGALAELGELMADNLVSQGVTGASASDGLTTLANKILDIQTGGSCYHIEFDEASYIAVGGSVTVSCTLQQNYSPLANATVTFSDGTSQYSSITNQYGVATFSLTGLTTSATYTCTYQNVSDTCTVTVQSYLFYDACNSSSGLSNYGTPIGVGSTISTNYTSYNSTENAYDVRTNGDWGMIPITALTGADNYKISMLVKTRNNNGASRGGFGFLASDSTNVFPSWKIEGNGACNYTLKQGSSEPNTKVCDTPNAQSTWYKIELIKTGTSYTCNVYNSNDTLLGTHTTTVDLGSSVRCGLYRVGGSSYGAYVKEIKAEPI